jgi:DNA-binding NtrC family response regulator
MPIMIPTSKPSILLVDDQPEELAALAASLTKDGFAVRCEEDDRKALPNGTAGVDVLISKLRLRGNGAGIKLVRTWRKDRPLTPILAIAGERDVEPAVEAMRLGADDCLMQPVQPDKLAASVRRVLSIRRQDQVTHEPGGPSDVLSRFDGIVGRSDVMQRVFDQAERVAPTDSTVLITGATGTGKELLAEAIHRLSRRSKGKFVPVNVAAVPTTLIESELFGHVKGAFTDAATERIGRFEAAEGGTLFIDEIGDLKLQSQAKLLRVLESRVINRVGCNENRPVDVRVLAATSRNLERMVSAGAFREDLYYRLNVVRLELPELHERCEDIPMLANHFLEELAQLHRKPHLKLSSELRDFVQTHAWPGNVRQLRNCIESMVVMAKADAEVLRIEDLPTTIDAPGKIDGLSDLPLAGYALADLEDQAILQTLAENRGNRTRSAEILGISVRTLQRKLKRFPARDDE